MANGSITIRLSRNDIEMIDRKVEQGYFTSRSDVVRHSIRVHLTRMDEIEKRRDEMAKTALEKGITREAVRASQKKARKKVYKEVYGDD